jgi:hypothetical protein
MLKILRNIFKSTRQREKEKDFYDEESSSLLSDTDTPTKPTNKGILTNSVCYLTIIPGIYLLASIFIVLYLLILNSKEQLVTNKEKIPDFYDLPKMSVTMFHIYTVVTSICGMAIVIVLFVVLKQRFKVPEFINKNYKLYIMMFFGLMSNFFNFAKGFSPYLVIFNISKDINSDLTMKLTHILFLGVVFFSILFSIYSISVLDLLRMKKVKQMNTLDNWYSYKIVILVYLTSFFIIYIIFLLYDNKAFTLIDGSSLKKVFENHLKLVISTFPYFIHILNAVLMFSFYFELRYVNLALSQNLEVDYLFEESEKQLF